MEIEDALLCRRPITTRQFRPSYQRHSQGFRSLLSGERRPLRLTFGDDEPRRRAGLEW